MLCLQGFLDCSSMNRLSSSKRSRVAILHFLWGCRRSTSRGSKETFAATTWSFSGRSATKTFSFSWIAKRVSLLLTPGDSCFISINENGACACEHVMTLLNLQDILPIRVKWDDTAYICNSSRLCNLTLFWSNLPD